MTNPPDTIYARMERARNFFKKGEIKRRIIQGNMDLAFEAYDVTSLCGTLYADNQKMKEALYKIATCPRTTMNEDDIQEMAEPNTAEQRIIAIQRETISIQEETIEILKKEQKRLLLVTSNLSVACMILCVIVLTFILL